jgi:transcription antitermination factor NusG
MSNTQIDSQFNWYALFVRSQNEVSVSRLLIEKAGIETLVPKRRVWKKVAGKIKIKEKPAFRSYVFVHLDIKQVKLSNIFSINGIFDFVRFGGYPAPIPGEQIKSAEILLSSENLIHELEHQKLKPDDRVEVIDGPLRGATGSFIKSDLNSGNLIVNIDMFERSLTTQVDSQLVKAV